MKHARILDREPVRGAQIEAPDARCGVMDIFYTSPDSAPFTAHTAATNTQVTNKGFMKNLIDAAMEVGNFNTLLSAFKSASLIDMLRSPGQYTIFAPTDAAFKRLPAGSLDALFKDARTLKPFLCNHMMVGVKAANDILPGELKPMEGRTLRASLHGSAVHINGATIVQSDIRATNGIIHAIDDVLAPLNPILASVA
jgi:uncharacterized surface protein with fasciclin (FAS1) repeats